MTLLDKLRNGPAQRLARESLGERSASPATAAQTAPDARELGWTRDRTRGVMLLELGRIRPDPNQPRKQFDQDELDRLAGSVRSRGILQPVRVRWEGDAWILIAGECRYRAAVAANLVAIPAMRVEGLASEADVLEDQIAEQQLRSTWSPIEEAKSFRCIMQLRRWEPWEICKALHLDKSKVSRTLALLDLADEVQALIGVGERKLSPTAALELRKLEPAQQLAVAQAAIGDKLTVGETADLVATARGKQPEKTPRITHKGRVIKLPGRAGKVTVTLTSGATDDDAEILKALDQARLQVSGTEQAA